MSRKWPRIHSELISKHAIFDLHAERYESPRTGEALDVIVVEPPDWVNVIALTADDSVLFIRQYRFGSGAVTLEIPGGMLDAQGEEPLLAAQRELREETGYVAERWTHLGSVAPNPAFVRNRLHTYLAEGANAVGELDLDPGEDIVVELRPLVSVDALIASGELDHALVAVAFQKLSLHRRGFRLV